MSGASIAALATLLLTMFAGATDFARNYAALLETQVREQMWMAVPGNPVFWNCLIFVIAMAVVLLSLSACGLLLLHRLASRKMADLTDGNSGA